MGSSEETLERDLEKAYKELSEMEYVHISEIALGTVMWECMMLLEEIYGHSPGFKKAIEEQAWELKITVEKLKEEETGIRALGFLDALPLVGSLWDELLATTSKFRVGEFSRRGIIFYTLRHLGIHVEEIKSIHDELQNKDLSTEKKVRFIKRLIEILKESEHLLIREKETLLRDHRNHASVTRVITHEQMHFVEEYLAEDRKHLRIGNKWGEHYTYAIDRIARYFKPDVPLGFKELEEERKIFIPRIRRIMEESAYGSPIFGVTIAMLIATIALADAVRRREGGNENRELHVAAFSHSTLRDLAELAQRAVNNIQNTEMQASLKTMRIDALQYLKNHEYNIKQRIEKNLGELSSIKLEPKTKEALISFLKTDLIKNLIYYIAALDVGGFHGEAQQYLYQLRTIIAEKFKELLDGLGKLEHEIVDSGLRAFALLKNNISYDNELMRRILAEISHQ